MPSLDDIAAGQSLEQSVTFDQPMLDAFVAVSGDVAPIHVDDRHAAAMGFAGRLVHGFLVAVPYSRMMGMHLPGPDTVIQRVQLDMLMPVAVGETLRYRVVVDRVVPAVKAVMLSLSARNERDEVVSRWTATCVFRRSTLEELRPGGGTERT